MSKHTMPPWVIVMLVVLLLASSLLQDFAHAQESVVSVHHPVAVGWETYPPFVDGTPTATPTPEPLFIEDILPDIYGTMGVTMTLIGNVGVGENPVVTILDPTDTTTTLEVIEEFISPEQLVVLMPTGYNWVSGNYVLTVQVGTRTADFPFQVVFCSTCKPAKSRRAR